LFLQLLEDDVSSPTCKNVIRREGDLDFHLLSKMNYLQKTRLPYEIIMIN